jgi:hypothetical protein
MRTQGIGTAPGEGVERLGQRAATFTAETASQPRRQVGRMRQSTILLASILLRFLSIGHTVCRAFLAISDLGHACNDVPVGSRRLWRSGAFGKRSKGASPLLPDNPAPNRIFEKYIGHLREVLGR